MFFVLARIAQCAGAVMFTATLIGKAGSADALYSLIPASALIIIGATLEMVWFKHGSW